MGKQYYTLIAGLPDLVISDVTSAPSAHLFLSELRKQLTRDDFKLAQVLMLPVDNKNLWNLLSQNDTEFIYTGNFRLTDFEHAIEFRKNLEHPIDEMPDYFHRFINAYLDEIDLYPDMAKENQLVQLFFDYLASVKNRFLTDWFRFDQTLRNIVVALQAKKYGLNYDKHLLGEGEIISNLKRNQARDFGLAGEFPLIEKLMQIVGTMPIDVSASDVNLLETEMKLDTLRWEYIDERLFFEYFSIDRVLGYLLKLTILDRWRILDRTAGEQIFRLFIENLKPELLSSKGDNSSN